KVVRETPAAFAMSATDGCAPWGRMRVASRMIRSLGGPAVAMWDDTRCDVQSCQVPAAPLRDERRSASLWSYARTARTRGASRVSRPAARGKADRPGLDVTETQLPAAHPPGRVRAPARRRHL